MERLSPFHQYRYQGDDRVHTYFNNQLYTFSNGLSPSDQRDYDLRTGEFADSLADFWSGQARQRRDFTWWLNRRRRDHSHFSSTHQSPTR